MSAPEAVAEKIRTDFAAMLAKLKRIDPPDGHKWLPQVGPLNWWNRDIIQSVRGIGPSIYLRRDPANDEDPSQLRVEVRLNWNEIGEAPRLDLLRCILWCERGRRIGFAAKSLLPASAVFLRGADVDELYTRIALHLDPALATYRRWLASRYDKD